MSMNRFKQTISFLLKIMSLLGFIIGFYYLFCYMFPSDKSTAWGYLIPVTAGFIIQLIFGSLSILLELKSNPLPPKNTLEKVGVITSKINKTILVILGIIISASAIYFIYDAVIL